MTNTTKLLTDAEKRVQAGDVPDEVVRIFAEACLGVANIDDVSHTEWQTTTAAYEAGRLAGVAEAKREVIQQMQGKQISINKREDELTWIHNFLRQVKGRGIGADSLIEYLEQQQ